MPCILFVNATHASVVLLCAACLPSLAPPLLSLADTGCALSLFCSQKRAHHPQQQQQQAHRHQQPRSSEWMQGQAAGQVLAAPQQQQQLAQQVSKQVHPLPHLPASLTMQQRMHRPEA
jgi:hypothetical protein